MTDQNQADRAAIARTSRQMVAAIEGDDVEGILALLTADHITMDPNRPAIDDVIKLRAWHEGRISAFTSQVTLSSDELLVSGDWAYQRWSGSFVVTPRGGGSPIRDVLKGIWIWQRQPDGAWKMSRSIFNSDLPLPTAQRG